MTARRLAGPLALAALAALTWALLALSPFSVVVVAGESMEPVLHGGDVVLLRERAAYAAGDVVAYRVPSGEPGAGLVVIHRVVGGSAAEGFITRGDNETGRDPWRPGPADVLGRRALVVPRLGVAIGFLRSGLGLAGLAALVAFGLALRPGRPGAAGSRSPRRPRPPTRA